MFLRNFDNHLLGLLMLPGINQEMGQNPDSYKDRSSVLTLSWGGVTEVKDGAINQRASNGTISAVSYGYRPANSSWIPVTVL